MKAIATDIKVAQKDMPRGIKFKVSSNGKMMNMLSDTLYSDKIKAVVRELSTNALDAHRDAGVDKPFSLTLPTMDSQEFCIRDYGTGLSKEDMEQNVYTIYGVSTREESNEFVGALGLGSKSPLAYVDSFTVSSYYNGMKYTYICSKNKRGVPVLFRVGEATTTEGNGLEVKFVAQKYNYSSFKVAAEKIYQHFPILPTCNIKLTINKPEVILSGDGWALHKDNNAAYAVMGNVRYPIDSSQLTSERSNQPISWYQYENGTQELKTTQVNVRQLLDLSFQLDFEIGDIDFDLGREKLQYNQHTKDKILEKLAQISTDLTAKIEQKISGAKNHWEARQEYHILSKKFGYIVLKSLNDVKWNGKSIKDDISLKPLNYVVKRFYIRSYCSSVTQATTDCIGGYQKTIFLLDDIKKGAIKTAQELVRRDGGQVYLIPPSIDIKKFYDTVGIDETYIQFASELYPQFKSTTVRNTTTQVPCCIFVPSNSYYTTRKSFWADHTVNLEDGGYYIELINFYPIAKNGKMEGAVLTKVLDYAVSLGVFKAAPTLIGIKTRWLKKYKESKKWINILDYIVEALNKISFARGVSTDDVQYYSSNVHRDAYIYNYEVDCPVWEEYHSIIQAIEKDKESNQAYKYLTTHLHITKDINQPQNRLEQCHNAFLAKYPLLSVVQRYLSSREQTLVKDYVHQIAKFSKLEKPNV